MFLSNCPSINWVLLKLLAFARSSLSWYTHPEENPDGQPVRGLGKLNLPLGHDDVDEVGGRVVDTGAAANRGLDSTPAAQVG